PLIGSLPANTKRLIVFFLTRFRDITSKIVIKIFFGHQHGSPRGNAASAVIYRANNFSAAWVVLRLKAFMSCCRAANNKGCAQRIKAAVVFSSDGLPAIRTLLYFNNTMAVCGHF